MRVAYEDLQLDSLWVIHPGRACWPMAEGIEATAFSDLPVAGPLPVPSRPQAAAGESSRLLRPPNHEVVAIPLGRDLRQSEL